MVLKKRQARRWMYLLLISAGLILAYCTVRLGVWSELKEDDQRTNILLLGMGGETHAAGQYLTDTIMIASIDTTTREVSLLSIPRDLLITDSEGAERKINSLYIFEKNNGSHNNGISSLREIISEITGLEIHYYALIDFVGFSEIIDTLGGIDIEIQKDFTDDFYGVTFSAGITHFDSALALTYCRSRFSSGTEGSDFARAARQQQVLLAIRDKLLSSESLLTPGSLTKSFTSINRYLWTDISPTEALKIWDYFKNLDMEHMSRAVLSTQNVLTPSYLSDGTYVLHPASDNWAEIRSFIQEFLTSTELVR